ncbi:MAG TPA: maleylpyruvate isomerase N-terminal domain-containing protein [Acidimicrobiales bacterium]|nr:maleylpyruvate isomerase N-terminal domain-containing protein [Acidimicrobiales bacterium]
MQLTPRYDGAAPLSVEVPFGDPSVPLVRQRRRMAEMLGALETDQWMVASRCDGWSVQDVIAHLAGVNRFWALSIRSGLAGSPTRYLTDFDPVTTPQRMVEPTRALAPGAVLDDFADSVDDLGDAIGGVDDASWERPAEAPPGHIALRALALHALWDAWIHERDIMLPLGLVPVEEADEVTGSLLYAAILGPALMAASGRRLSGKLAIRADRPTINFVVDVGVSVVARPPAAADADAWQLTGSAVSLVEGLSARMALSHDLPADDSWLVDGLGKAFAPVR